MKKVEDFGRLVKNPFMRSQNGGLRLGWYHLCYDPRYENIGGIIWYQLPRSYSWTVCLLDSIDYEPYKLESVDLYYV